MSTKKEKLRAEKQRIKAAKIEKVKRQQILQSRWRCNICGEWIKFSSKCKHLQKIHNIIVEDTSSYFKSAKEIRKERNDAVSGKQMRERYEKNMASADNETFTCGETVSGPPFIHIIYNPVGTNRRKH